MVYKADRRISVSQDGTRILEPGAQEDGFLLVTKGQELSDEQAEALGLTGGGKKTSELVRARAAHLGGGINLHTRPAGWDEELDTEGYAEDLRAQHPGLSESTVKFMGNADIGTRVSHESQVATDRETVEDALKTGRHSTVLGDETRYPAQIGPVSGVTAPSVREGTEEALDEVGTQPEGQPAEEPSATADTKTKKNK